MLLLHENYLATSERENLSVMTAQSRVSQRGWVLMLQPNTPVLITALQQLYAFNK